MTDPTLLEFVANDKDDGAGPTEGGEIELDWDEYWEPLGARLEIEVNGGQPSG